MKGRWTIVLLIVSLAVNLFLIGAAAGVIALGSRMAHLRAGRPIPVLRAAAASLRPEDRRAFVATLRQGGRAARPTVLQSRALKREVWASVGEATFDPAAAKAKLRQARALDQDTRTTIEDAVIDFIARLPADERARFGAAVTREIPADGPARR